MRKIYAILLLLFPVFSCEKIIDIELPKGDNKLVLNSFFSENNFLKVRVSSNIELLDTIDDSIADAVVKLSDNNQNEEYLKYIGNGFYKSDKLKSSSTGKYSVTVTHPTFTTVSATSSIPHPLELDSIHHEYEAFIDEDGFARSVLNLHFTDNAEQKNYYEVFLLQEFGTEDTSFIWNVKPICNSACINNEGYNEFYPYYLPFSDEIINGTNVSLSIEYGRLSPSAKLIVFFRTVSEEYYHYKKRLILHAENQSSDIWDGIGNPVSLYSNIQEGYGIFAGYAEKKYIVTP